MKTRLMSVFVVMVALAFLAGGTRFTQAQRPEPPSAGSPQILLVGGV